MVKRSKGERSKRGTADVYYSTYSTYSNIQYIQLIQIFSTFNSFSIFNLFKYSTMRILSVSFGLPANYDARLLPKLRGAIAQKAGLENDEFHNHNNAEGAAVAFHYRYPMIQYRVQQNTLTLTCWNEGVDALQHFFAQPDWTLTLDTGESITLRISDMRLRELEPSISANLRRYTLRDWYALNQESFRTYINADEAEQRTLLERLLTSQIVLMLNSVGCNPTERVQVIIHDFRSYVMEHKRQKIRVFCPEFSCNVVLPTGLGVGKAAAMGFGVITSPRPSPKERECARLAV
jgi:Cas6b C-terminal domain/Cas6b N-terminal domain